MTPSRSTLLFAIAVFVIVAATGCNHTTSPGGGGMIAGRVVLFDSTRMELSDFSGTKVSIDGTTLSTLTDAVGAWQIGGLPEGRYDITASKPGFGTFHWYQQVMVGGRLDVQTAAIARMKDFTPVISLGSFAGALSLFDSAGHSIIGYCDIDSTSKPSDPHLAVTMFDPVDCYISTNDLRAAGVASGQVLYVSASTIFDGYDGYSIGYAVSFYDPVHHETRYASTGPKSNVIKVTMP
ncbi:MAG: carboxypeptidase-like regulatory domain-containing protein [Bacteroidota bacterium]|nr:carboxypeptidase-like regulatory domain-containing protein [Bacteroidota bacterium]MDP4232159.1 carboxypeptidase-like regulatory domain-containing protein [Bacteroidota bacterium]MDP4241133.1 carboxypeptidase-like regulatory domain-containing protein [Bacteroidota bacterium]MDP4286525.1 carboxypeptidase-like regulatory domain-containing protein [Bacteroidota bacterium]